MNEKSLQAALQDLPLGGLRYFEKIGSTNDAALFWKDAEDLSLVVANEQTAGRGRSGRSWQTPPDSALAFSLLLRPKIDEKKNISLFTGLGALALVTTLENAFGLKAQIKWPNDVLLRGKKLAGILIETSWLGEEINGIVLGMGVNVAAAAVPSPEKLDFPATSLEDALNKHVDRITLLQDILAALFERRPRLGTESFIHAWDENLAFREEQVWVQGRNGRVIHGKVLGLNPDGSLRLDTKKSIHFGDVRLRPIAL